MGIVFSDFGPYHATRITALAAELRKAKTDLIAFRFSEASDLYGWTPAEPEGTAVVTLAGKYPAGFGNAVRLGFRFAKKLRKHKVKHVFLPSYSPLPNLLCLLAAKLTGAKAILMNESWGGTEKAGFAGRLLKKLLVRTFDAGLVGGTPQKDYAVKYGLASAKIFLGYDVVDIHHFANEALRWKGVSAEDLPVPNLPARFFLNLGRFVPKKNLGLIVQAYGMAVRQNPETNIALVFVGEGSEEGRLRTMTKELGLRVRNGAEEKANAAAGPEVVFYPFQQVDKTPLFFSRCEAFILPSLYEEWGLVVNEAMACGAPVLVSENVGCAKDLLVPDKNGFTFDPQDAASLLCLLQRFIDDPLLSRRLGAHGREHIAAWGPDRFASGAISAMASAEGRKTAVER